MSSPGHGPDTPVQDPHQTEAALSAGAQLRSTNLGGGLEPPSAGGGTQHSTGVLVNPRPDESSLSSEGATNPTSTKDAVAAKAAAESGSGLASTSDVAAPQAATGGSSSDLQPPTNVSCETVVASGARQRCKAPMSAISQPAATGLQSFDSSEESSTEDDNPSDPLHYDPATIARMADFEATHELHLMPNSLHIRGSGLACRMHCALISDGQGFILVPMHSSGRCITTNFSLVF